MNPSAPESPPPLTGEQAFDALMRAALAHRAGRLDEAEAIYRALLARNPRIPDANHNLAILLLQRRQPLQSALPLFRAAWEGDPGNVQFGASFLRALVQLGHEEEAARTHDEAQRRGVTLPAPASFRPTAGPPSTETIPGGRERAITNELQEALRGKDWQALFAKAESATKSFPAWRVGWHFLALASERLGRSADALIHYRKAIALGVDDRHALLAVGRLELASGLVKEAIRSFSAVARRWPRDAEALLGLSDGWSADNAADRAEAAARQAIAVAPELPAAWACLGKVVAAKGDAMQASAALERALELDLDDRDAFKVLGQLLVDLGQAHKAEALCQRLLAQRPGRQDALYALGTLQGAGGRLEESEASFRELCRHDPLNFAARSSLICLLNYREERFRGERLEEARRFGADARAQASSQRLPAWSGEANPARLRVGLVSGDLREHPVGYFLESVLGSPAAREIDWFAYSTTRLHDETTNRLRAQVQCWRNVSGFSAHECASHIRRDDIHILVDLSGHTLHNMLPAFAWRPAPVQVSWLGYFATTGMREIDYLLADPVGLPKSLEDQFEEQIWRLPVRYCFSPPSPTPQQAPSPAATRGHITFGCFQGQQKINTLVIELWARILNALPDASLRIQNAYFDREDNRVSFSKRLGEAGVPVDRVSLHGQAPRSRYLVDVGNTDIILDTHPYTGGTTTCEALWMGVPTVTLDGDTLLTRQGTSILTAAGLADWVAASPDEYVDLAIRKALAPGGLAALRAQLRDRLASTPLFNPEIFTSHLVQALRAMWKQRT